MTLRVICGRDRPVCFENPREVLRASTALEVPALFRRAERALSNGRWIAGYLSYGLGAAAAGIPVRSSTWPLAAIGIFDGPQDEIATAVGEFRMSPLLPRIRFDEYASSLRSLQRAIYDGNAYQVNYTIPFDVSVSGDRFALWYELAAETGAAYQAFVDDDGRQILSWSPELFLRFDGTRLSTKPMKGTAAPGSEQELATPKNRAEHVMIVDLLRNDFQRICEGVEVERLFEVERYPTFSTMTSTISGTLRNDVTLEDLFRATFPCGSVTGAPKRAAMQHVANTERFPRDAYCGSIGYLSPGRTGWWNVAIRTAQFDRGPAGRFDAGGGIVADSNAAAEWHEIDVKMAFLRKAAGVVTVLETFASAAAEDVVSLHLDRLFRTLDAFGGFASRAEILEALRSKRGLPNTIVRLRACTDGIFAIALERAETAREPVRVCFAHDRVHSEDPFLHWKTSWRPQYERGARDASERNCFDAIFENERGELTEGARTTLFVRREGLLLTPHLRCGLLPGILRERLLREGRAKEAVLHADDLATADEVLIGNSARGLLRAIVV